MMMKSTSLFLLFLVQLCGGQYSNGFNRRPSLHGARSNLGGNDTDSGNYQRQSRIMLPRTRSGSRMSRLHESLLRARMRQLSTQGLSDEQMKTETSSTASSSYTASHVHYLQRSVRKMTLTVSKMEDKVDKFEKWKTSSEERMAGLVKMIERLQNERVAEKEEIPETDSPTREEFELLKQQTQDNVAMITNITHELEEREFIIKRQVDQDGEIQPQESHNDQETPSRLRTSQSNEFATLSKEVQTLNDTVLIQKKIVERLYARVGKVQKCCRMNTYFARRLGDHEKGIKEARGKSNNALKYLRIENSRIQSINSKLKDHRQKIEALQDDVLSYKAIASQANQRMMEQMENNLKTVNKTIQAVTGEEKGTITHKLNIFEKRITENSETIGSFAFYAGEQMEQVNKLSAAMVDLKSSHEAEKRAWVVNMSRVERRVQRNKDNTANIRATVRQLRHSVRLVNASVKINSDILGQLTQSLQKDRTNQIKELHDDIAEIHTSADLLTKRMKNMQAQIGNITAFDTRTEEKIQTISEKLSNYEKRNDELEVNITVKLKESEAQMANHLDISINEINATFNLLQSEQDKSSRQFSKANDEQEMKVNELERKMTKSNDELVRLSDSLNELTDNALKRNAAMSEDQSKIREFVDRLVLNFTGSVTKLEDIELSQRKNINELKNNISNVNQTLEELRLALKDHQNADETASIKEKIEKLDEMSYNMSEKIKLHESDAISTKRRVESIKTSIETRSDHNEEMTSDLAASTALLEEQFETFTLKVTAKFEDVNERGKLYKVEVDKRIKDIERSNKTLYDKLESHVREMNAVKDAMTSLQEKEDSVSESISSFGNVIAKHDFVQRNLTSVSDKVKETLQGQGLALKSIHKIMQQLNVSLIESQNSIDRSYFEQLKTQEGDITAMRGLMRNFSSLLTKVFNDQLSHDVDHARISERQRTLVEKVDSCDASIDEVKGTIKTNSENAESVKSKVMSNIDKLLVLTKKVDDQVMKLDQIGENSKNLLSLGKKFNSTKTNVDSNLTLLFERLRAAEKIGNSDREEHKQNILQLSQDVEGLKAGTTKLKNETLKIHERQSLIKANISKLMDCGEITKALQSRMSETESDVNSLDKDLDSVINEISTLSRNENATKTELHILQRQTEALQTDSSEQKKLIKRLSTQVSKLQQKQDRANATISEVLPEIAQEKKNLQTALNEIQEQKVKLETLSALSVEQNETLEKWASITNSVSSTVKSLQTSNSGVISLTQTMKNDLIKQDKRLTEMSEKIRDTAAKFIALNATINKPAHKEAFEKTKTLEKEVTKIKENLWYIAEDMENNYNSTQQILDQLYDHDERITLINGETSALLSSLTSSVASLDSSLQNVNDSMWFDINDLKELITDFQDAFDTSNRQRARYREEFEVFSSNTSNQFNHFSTNIDYLTQIVRESNRAVDENRDRLNALNETMLFVRLSIPALSAPGVEDGFFEVKDSSNANRFFSFTDLPDTSLQQGSVQGSDRKRSDYDRGAILNGAVDDFPTNEQGASWIADDFVTEDEYSENYDFGSLERRKRMVKEVRRIDHKMSDVLEMIDSLQTNVYRIGNETESLKIVDATTAQTAVETTIAFSVGLTKIFVCCGTVVFDKIFSNSGSGYDASTGKFTAVRNGHYAFVMAVSERNSFVNAAIVYNNMPQVTVRMDHSSGHYEQSQSTNVVLLRLSAGDQVWLQTYAGSLLGYQHPAATLSGFLIAG